MRRNALFAALLAAGAVAATAPARAEGKHDTLTIGIAQFPSSLQPDIDAEVVRSYAMGFVVRQITAFGPDWKNSCLLCTELPTLDNGLAKIEDRPDGKKGMAVTIKLKPDLQWGDGVPVTAKDIAFTWKIGSDPEQRLLQPQSVEPRHQRRRGRRAHRRAASRPRALRLQPVGSDPARAYRGRDRRRVAQARRIHQQPRSTTARR